MNYLDSVPIERRLLEVVFIIDSYELGTDEKIRCLKQGLEGALHRIGMIEEKNADVQPRVSVLCFSSAIRWYEDLKSVEPLDDVFSSGSSDREVVSLGEVFDELNRKSSRKALFSTDDAGKRGFFPPLYIFLLQGNSYTTWEESVKCLCQNNWYKNGAKIVVSLGQGVDLKLVSELRAQELRITAPEQFSSILEQITKPVDIIASCSSVMLDGCVSRRDEYYRTILGDCITEHFGDYSYS